MQRRVLSSPGVVSLILILQIIPLLLFPPSSYSLKTQEWWLPVLLVIMVLIADFQIIVRHTTSMNPWYLLAFAQGFNIISRLMMLWPHATTTAGRTVTPNWSYVILTVLAMAMSVWLLSYMEQPEVRMAYLPR